MDGTNRSIITIGATALVVQKHDQRTVRLTEGIVNYIKKVYQTHYFLDKMRGD